MVTSSLNPGDGRSSHPRSSRQRYRAFVKDYAARRLDDALEAEADPPESRSLRRGRRREYLHEYLRWLWPYRYAAGALLLLALGAAGLQMVEQIGGKPLASKG